MAPKRAAAASAEEAASAKRATKPRAAAVKPTAPAEAAEVDGAAAASPPALKYTPKATPAFAKVAPTLEESSAPRHADGSLAFADHPEFRPRLTPKQAIHAGIFGGCYFNPRGGKPGITSPGGVAVTHKEFPADWFAGLPEKMYISRRYNCPTNKHKVASGQDQAAWEKSGWINAQDPRGWFQWYCRFFTGRRTADDARQISRWTGVAGPKGRWKRALLNKIIAANAAFDDGRVSPVIRQTLLHWAFEVTQADVSAWASK